MIQKNTIWFDEYNQSGDTDKALRALKKSEPEFIISYTISPMHGVDILKRRQGKTQDGEK